MAKWKILKKGDKVYLSVVYRCHVKRYGCYYIMFPEVGDLHIPLPDLGNPEAEVEDEAEE